MILTLQQCQHHQVMWMGRLKTPPHHLTIVKNNLSYDYICYDNVIRGTPYGCLQGRREGSSLNVLFFPKTQHNIYIIDFFSLKTPKIRQATLPPFSLLTHEVGERQPLIMIITTKILRYYEQKNHRSTCPCEQNITMGRN